MLKSKHFNLEWELRDWVNANIRVGDIISIIKVASNGDFILFYSE